MTIDISNLVALALTGRFAHAAKEAAALRSEKGDQPQAARALACKAASLREPRLLALAWALWPAALGGSCESFLLALPTRVAHFCMRQSPELLARAARAGQEEEAKREAERSRLQAAKEKAKSAAEGAPTKAEISRADAVKARRAELGRVDLTSGRPAPVVQGRPRRKIRR